MCHFLQHARNTGSIQCDKMWNVAYILFKIQIDGIGIMDNCVLCVDRQWMI